MALFGSKKRHGNAGNAAKPKIAPQFTPESRETPIQFAVREFFISSMSNINRNPQDRAMANQSARQSTDNESVVDIELNMSVNPETPNAGGKQQPPMLILSRDNALVETVRKSAPRGTRVVTAPSLDQAAGQLPTLQPGVLLIDTACAPDVGAMVAQLTQHFPDMVVVVAGKSEDSQALMRLTAAGQIYRFLLLPLS